eukprot:sb/3466846/
MHKMVHIRQSNKEREREKKRGREKERERNKERGTEPLYNMCRYACPEHTHDSHMTYRAPLSASLYLTISLFFYLSLSSSLSLLSLSLSLNDLSSTLSFPLSDYLSLLLSLSLFFSLSSISLSLSQRFGYSTLLSTLVFTYNYKTALEAAKRKGFFIPMLAVFLNQVEHEHAFYSKLEKLVFPSEDINYSWTELSQSGEFDSEKVSDKMSGSLSKWLRSKSFSTSSSPLRSHVEDKLRENVQSIVEQTNSCGQTNNLTVEETPLYTLRLYQQNSAQYDIPSSPVITKFLRIPFSQCQAAGEKWKESWERDILRSEALEPPT